MQDNIIFALQKYFREAGKESKVNDKVIAGMKENKHKTHKSFLKNELERKIKEAFNREVALKKQIQQ